MRATPRPVAIVLYFMPYHLDGVDVSASIATSAKELMSEIHSG